MKIKPLQSVVLGLGICLLLVVTWQLGRVYISLLDKSKAEPAGPNESVILVLPQLEFWTCQVGVFDNRDNGQAERARLEKLGFLSEIFADNPWRIGVGLALSQNDLEPLRAKLNQEGIANIVKKVKIQEKSFKISGNNAESMSEILKNVNNFISGNYSVDKNEMFNINYKEEEVKQIAEKIAEIAGCTETMKAQQLRLTIFSRYQNLIDQLSKTSPA